MWKGLIFIVIFHSTAARPGFGPTDQEWGYVTVRESNHMFWWLHYTTANVSQYTERPLIIWLQGGPGASSTGYGNFAELGPLDVNLEPRNSTWVQYSNVLFVDNPAGCGFGYVDRNDDFVKNNSQIASDFLVFLKEFYEQLPAFKKVPLYIFCESYGGKMTAEIALVIDQARRRGDIETNFKGVGLGDSWISPIDSILNYAPYLLNLGHIDQTGYHNIMKVAHRIKTAIDNNDMELASSLWYTVTTKVEMQTYGVDFYNVLKKVDAYSVKEGNVPFRQLKDDNDLIYSIMNDHVGPALNISRKWVDQNDLVFDSLLLDFMTPVTSIVERLLNETDLTVAVYNGQLDLIVDTPGTVKWVERLNFKDKALWDSAPRLGFAADNDYFEGYVKKYGKFAFYWVDRAGHMVPADNPYAMTYILTDVTNDFEV